jgi:hypothetical protein
MLFLESATAQLSAGISKTRQDKSLSSIQNYSEVFSVCVSRHLEIWIFGSKKENDRSYSSHLLSALLLFRVLVLYSVLAQLL